MMFKLVNNLAPPYFTYVFTTNSYFLSQNLRNADFSQVPMKKYEMVKSNSHIVVLKFGIVYQGK